MATNILPPIPREQIAENHSWRDWFNNLGIYIQTAQTGGNTWSIQQGGTGATTADGARLNIGIGSLGTQNYNNVAITGGYLDSVSITSSTFTGSVSLTNNTDTAVGATGTASALPALPVGYVVINISGTDYKLPYYNT
jgi:hypothetical protein